MPNLIFSNKKNRFPSAAFVRSYLVLKHYVLCYQKLPGESHVRTDQLNKHANYLVYTAVMAVLNLNENEQWKNGPFLF